MTYEPFVQMCVERPNFDLMRRAYEDYRMDRAPCKGGVPNQCAVRMSVAMVRCGMDFIGFPNQRRIHRGRSICQLMPDHVLGARELADYLRMILPEPVRYGGAAAATARAALNNRKGIIYFDNCYARTPGGPQTGDHIDLWDGSRYFIEHISAPAGENAREGVDLFGQSRFIWFFSLD